MKRSHEADAEAPLHSILDELGVLMRAPQLFPQTRDLDALAGIGRDDVVETANGTGN